MKFKWKKGAAGALAILIALTGTAGFAEGLDMAYMDLMISALKAQPVEEREDFGELLKITIYDADAIEVTKSNYESQLTEAQKDFMESNGINASVVVSSLDALKTWSFTDRMALVDAAVSLDKSKMLTLNDKYQDNNTGGSGAGAGTSTGSGQASMPSEEVKQTLVEKGIAIEKPVLAEGKSFSDLSSHWAAAQVNLLTRTGVIAGFPDMTYRPEQPLTRAEVVTMMVKAFSKEYKMLKPGVLPLDVSPLDWHYDFMGYAAYLGLYEVLDGRALPNEPLTREKTANLLANMTEVLKLSTEGGISPSFKDIGTLKAASQADLLYLSRLGVFSGYPDGTFRPNQVVTRAEASVLMIKMMQLFYGNFE